MLNLPQSAFRSISAPLVNPDADTIPPAELNFPERYTEWRHNQYAAIERILSSDKRFVVICAPTGFGKAGVVMGAAAMSGRRCAVLTMTKGLQDQYREFADMLSDIRGLANYACPITAQLGIAAGTTVADAPCQCGYQCRLRWSGGCEYFARYRAAQHADMFCTNYACWMYDSFKESEQTGNLQFGVDPETTGDRPIGILFADEAHNILSALSMFIGIDLSRKECLALHLPWPDAGGSVDDWQLWAMELVEDMAERAGQLETRLRTGDSGQGQWSEELKHLRDVGRKLERLAGMDAGDEWIITESDLNVESGTMSAVRFDPLSPARYAESALFRGVEKIVLVSATVRPKTAVMLGIDPADMEFVEYPSTFAVERRPIVHQPTVRMTYLNEQDDGLMQEWLKLLDAWIGERIALGRKGLIHAVSYRRMKFIVDNSEHSWCMMTHDTYNRARVIAEFRRSDGPRVLISPSVDTGYDFPNNDARFQVVAKIPFSSVTDPVVKARKAKDRDYDLYQAAQTLVQMTGRTTRSESDFSETLLADQSVEWAIPQMKRKGFLPRWWWDSFKSYDVAPLPIQFAEVEADRR